MTREEAIKGLKVLAKDFSGYKPNEEMFDMAIKALERTECEDAVSKEAVSSWLKQYGQDVLHGKYKFSLMYIWKKLMDLPSVTPKQPGWIPWDKNTRNSMKYTLQTLYRLAYNIHGVMDAIDDDNVKRLIALLEGGQDG